jgi:chromatin accessibility complex protein 1
MADERGKCELPLSRVRTIMKSSPDVSNINQEALFLAAKATVISKKPDVFCHFKICPS